jgi:hypothetical protein
MKLQPDEAIVARFMGQLEKWYLMLPAKYGGLKFTVGNNGLFFHTKGGGEPEFVRFPREIVFLTGSVIESGTEMEFNVHAAVFADEAENFVQEFEGGWKL